MNFVIIPNLNGRDTIGQTIDSLEDQIEYQDIVVVENNSSDGSLGYLKQNYPDVTIIEHQKNLGFAGGVNSGIRHAIESDADYVALLNNDAVADKDWLKNLLEVMEADTSVGIVACKLLTADGGHIDSTGEGYSVWGLPFPRGRCEAVSDKYDDQLDIFAASGGASLYRTEMLKQIGLFDEDFFAYYEDVDISFRAQLAGWKVRYAPKAIAYHQIGATSGKIKGFTTYQTLKNLPLIVRRDVPLRLLPKVFPRFWLAYNLFFWSAVMRGQGWPALKGLSYAIIYLPKNFWQRHKVQSTRKVSVNYIWNIMTHDLPPNAHRLRSLRSKYRKLVGKHG
jgi:GT2 family glycosyltransferase